MAETFSLGGRQYRTVSTSTIEHDIATTIVIRASGLGELTLGPDELPEAFAFRLLNTLMESGRTFEILGCLLVPADISDIDWTPALGKETAAKLRLITDPEEKATIRAQILAAITGFFASGLLSSEIFRNSSKAEALASTTSGGTTISATGR